MKVDHIRRRALLGTVASLPVFAGCSGVTSLISDPVARVQTDIGYQAQEPHVVGQPSFDTVPAIEAWLATGSEWLDQNILWENLNGERGSLRRVQQNFDSDRFFFTAIVGAVRWGYGLGKYRDSRFTDQTLVIYPEVERTSVGGPDEPSEPSDPAPDEPEFNYDYTFTLWRLRDGAQPPTEIRVEFEPDESSTETRSERS